MWKKEIAKRFAREIKKVQKIGYCGVFMRIHSLQRILLKSLSSSITCGYHPSMCKLTGCMETNLNFKFRENFGPSFVGTASALVKDLGDESRGFNFDLAAFLNSGIIRKRHLHFYAFPDKFGQWKKEFKLSYQ